MHSVQEQLTAFQKSMEADGAAQRAECRRLVSTAVRRAGWLLDEVLQVSAVSFSAGDRITQRTLLRALWRILGLAQN